MPFERRLYRYIEPKLSKEKKREKRGTIEEKGEKPMKYENPGSLSPRVVLALIDRKGI